MEWYPCRVLWTKFIGEMKNLKDGYENKKVISKLKSTLEVWGPDWNNLWGMSDS